MRAVRHGAPAIAALLLASSGLGAQLAEPDERPLAIELHNLRTPTSPAFTLLGVTPTSIARPSTPRALALDLVSSSRGGSVIPENYALEAAPYWLRPRPTLTFAQYTQPTIGQSIRQSFALSFATARGDALDDSTMHVALGARVTPLAGRPSSAFATLVDALDRAQRARTPIVRRYADALDAIDEAGSERLTTAAAIAAADAAGDAARAATLRAASVQAAERERVARAAAVSIERELATQADSMRALALAMGAAGAERVGLFGELAAAAAMVFPGEDFDAGAGSRAGAWVTLGYRTEFPRVDLLAVARVQRDMRFLDQTLVDLGGRVVWQRDRLELSGEVVHRNASGIADGSLPTNDPLVQSGARAVATIDFRATDALHVSASFGRDHPVEGRRPLVATFGITLQGGATPRVALPGG